MTFKQPKLTSKIKGQVVLDFFFTYGWAVLCLIAVIAALGYLGVFDLTSIVPNHCTMSQGISCMDYKVSANNIEVILKNNLGRDLSGVTAAATGCGTSPALNKMLEGQENRFIIPCSGAIVGSKYTGQLNLSYTTLDTGIFHNSLGKITSRIE